MRTVRPRPPWWTLALLLVVSAELTLQITAFGYRWWAGRAIESPIHDGELTVLCLGDSNTWGLGARPGESYPRQLERLLQKRWPERRIRVVNRGIPGTNSWNVARQLPQHVDRIQPDVILLLIGGNDVELHDLDLSAVGDLELATADRLRLHATRWLSRLRLYRLATFIIHPTIHQGDGIHFRDREGTTTTSEAARGEDAVRASVRSGLREVLMSNPEFAHEILRDDAAAMDGESVEAVNSRAMTLIDQQVQEALASQHIHPIVDVISLFQWSHRPDLAAGLVEQIQDRFDLTGEDDHAVSAALGHSDSVQFEGMAIALEQAIERDADDPRPRLALARLFLVREDFVRVEAIASSLLQMDLRSAAGPYLLAEGHYLLGVARLQQGDPGSAAAMLRQANELDPTHATRWEQLAYSQAAIGRTEQEREAWKQAFRLSLAINFLRRVGLSYTDPTEGRQAMRALLGEVKAASTRTDWQLLERFLEHEPDELIDRLRKTHIERIIEYATVRNIHIGLLTYANGPVDSVVQRQLRQIAQWHPEVLLIDAGRALSHRMNDPAQGLMIRNGTHPNAQGYGLLARYVMERLVDSGLLE